MSIDAALPTEDRGSGPAGGLEALRGAVAGEVLVHGDAGYDKARAVWNAIIDRRPLVIVRARAVADIQAAVHFARARGLMLSVRGGGHNVAGHAVCDDGVMIDLSSLRKVSVDPVARRAKVEGGATWGNVDSATQAVGLATPGGLISETGVGGLTLSGGIGWLRAAHGLAVDNLVAADVVLADGSLVRASEHENPDLLWALKGGGGNFGVVTMFEFTLHPLGPEIAFAGPVYPIETGPGPIRFWRDFLADKNDRIGSIIEFSTVPADPAYPEAFWGKRVYTIGALFCGDAAEGEALMQPLRELGPLVTDFSGRMDYCAVQQLFDTIIPFGQYRCYWKSLFLNALDNATIDKIFAGNAAPPSPNTLTSIWNFGGATAAVPEGATAFGNRAMLFMYSIDAIWGEREDDDTNIAWVRDFWQRMQPHSHEGRAYMNFAGFGEDGEALVRRSYGRNFERLRDVKRRYDPTNLFRSNQNISPE